ncbi:MAG: circadian clock protein KaiA [Microcoleaceae cyanobacterium]
MERESHHDSKANDLTQNSSATQHPQISLCMYAPSDTLRKGIMASLQRERYVLLEINSITEFIKYIIDEHHQVDCLVVVWDEDFSFLADQLQQQYIFLPIVVVDPQPISSEQTAVEDLTTSLYPKTDFVYHSYEVEVSIEQLDQIDNYIAQAIRQFVTHAVTTRLNDSSSPSDTPTELTRFIEPQQKRLAEKLQERLGYLGVYYKRNPRNFIRNLSTTERQELLDQLKSKYRQIVLNYFSKDPDLNKKIDEYVNIAFFADIPISRIVEIHMELMDQLSKQLKLEGRSEEMLLDYRLTLIDIMAHICEMYRRSIPKES